MRSDCISSYLFTLSTCISLFHSRDLFLMIEDSLVASPGKDLVPML